MGLKPGNSVSYATLEVLLLGFYGTYHRGDTIATSIVKHRDRGTSRCWCHANPVHMTLDVVGDLARECLYPFLLENAVGVCAFVKGQ
jgi:hypothetical protein